MGRNTGTEVLRAHAPLGTEMHPKELAHIAVRRLAAWRYGSNPKVTACRVLSCSGKVSLLNPAFSCWMRPAALWRSERSTHPSNTFTEISQIRFDQRSWRPRLDANKINPYDGKPPSSQQLFRAEVPPLTINCPAGVHKYRGLRSEQVSCTQL